MSHIRKNFIPRNEEFVCEHCQTSVIPAKKTFRNHCPRCLTSKHVDKVVPGDRASSCSGLMPAIAVEGSDPNALDLIHQCQQCDKTIRNKAVADDNREAIFNLLVTNY